MLLGVLAQSANVHPKRYCNLQFFRGYSRTPSTEKSKEPYEAKQAYNRSRILADLNWCTLRDVTLVHCAMELLVMICLQ